MAFVVGSVLIGGAASLGGAAIASKGAKDAAKTAAAGSDKQIAYNRESRDIALDLGSPYREAGYSALDKLGEMTGLIESGGTFGRPNTNEVQWQNSPWQLSQDNGQYTATMGNQKLFWDDSTNQWMDSKQSAYGNSKPVWKQGGDAGDWVQGRAGGGVMYNVNELGPESVYSGGAITRSSAPKTMPSDPRGYVHPNVQGRAIGGTMIDPNSMGDSVGGKPSPGVLTTNPDQPGRMTIDSYRQSLATNPNAYSLLDSARERGYTGGPQGLGDWMRAGNYGGTTESSPSQVWGSNYNSQNNPDPRWVTDPQGNQRYWDGSKWNDQGSEGWQDPAPGYTPTSGGGAVGGAGGGAVGGDGQYPTPQENPYDFTTDPGYNFRFNEGMRGLERSAAARGGLLSGGFGRKAIRYGQDYASNEFSNIYNRISNIAGLGQVSAGQGGVFAQNAGAQMGGAASQGALSSAYGQQGATNAWSNAFNQIAQLPWDQIQWGNRDPYSHLEDQG